ncbi:chemotaxis protein CheW [Candidatus Magnetaquicoccus inordinatus]|uniref:chemotaxis protein CheW n=1 Tax=Candidatus Magnetaquicoccus inordinatus TaxID=2496818 RepID=UPI00102BD34B|nr:chemotaxis protein CheW [Candidatus Magnetaquicoccus inordinatus]
MSEQMPSTHPEILAHAALLRQQEQIIVDEEQQHLLIFRLLDHYFALPGQYVREVLPAGDIIPVPGSSPFFLGVIPVRGEIASVLDLARLLEMLPTTIASTRKHSSRILIVQKEEKNTGMLVDAVEDIREFPKSAVQTQHSSLADHMQKFAHGELLFADHPTPLLDIDALFQHLQELCL